MLHTYRLHLVVTQRVAAVCDQRLPDLAYVLFIYLHNVKTSFDYRHHTYKKTDHRNIELTEVGPRFEMKCK